MWFTILWEWVLKVTKKKKRAKWVLEPILVAINMANPPLIHALLKATLSNTKLDPNVRDRARRTQIITQHRVDKKWSGFTDIPRTMQRGMPVAVPIDRPYPSGGVHPIIVIDDKP